MSAARCRHHPKRPSAGEVNGIPLCGRCRAEALRYSADAAPILEIALWADFGITLHAALEPKDEAARRAGLLDPLDRRRTRCRRD